MDAEVSPFLGLAIDGETYEDHLYRTDAQDGTIRRGVERGHHDCQQDLLHAAPEPKVLGHCFVVGSDHVDGGRVGVVSHPLWFYSFLPRLESQQTQNHQLDGQEQGREEGPDGCEAAAECQVADLSEYVDICFNQRQVEEDDEEINPYEIVQLVHRNINRRTFRFVR